MRTEVRWFKQDGTPSTGPDLGNLTPGSTGSVTLLLRNTGDTDLLGSTLVWFTDAPEGFKLFVGSDEVMETTLVDGEPVATFEAPGLLVGAELQFTFQQSVGASAAPGARAALVRIRPRLY